MADVGYFKQQGCPECGASGNMMMPQGGCVTCMSCGFSPC